MLLETSQHRLQLCYREETHTDLLSGREVVLAGSVCGPVRSSASGDIATSHTLQLCYREETQTDLLSGREVVLAGSVTTPVRSSTDGDITKQTPTVLPRGDPDSASEDIA